MNTVLRFASLAVLATACSVHTSATTQPITTSSSVPTSKIYPSTSAQSDGTSLTIYAALLSGRFLTLSGADQLSATVGDSPEQPLLLEPGGGDPHYSLSLTAPEKETHVLIHLRRALGEVDSVSLFVPPPFEVAGLPAGIVAGRTFSVDVTPAPTTTPWKELWVAYLDGTCVDGTTPLTGLVQGDTLAFDTTGLKHGATQDVRCGVTVKVQHQLVGTVDTAFEQPWPSDVVGVEERRFTTSVSF